MTMQQLSAILAAQLCYIHTALALRTPEIGRLHRDKRLGATRISSDDKPIQSSFVILIRLVQMAISRKIWFRFARFWFVAVRVREVGLFYSILSTTITANYACLFRLSLSLCCRLTVSLGIVARPTGLSSPYKNSQWEFEFRFSRPSWTSHGFSHFPVWGSMRSPFDNLCIQWEPREQWNTGTMGSVANPAKGDGAIAPSFGRQFFFIKIEANWKFYT